MKVWSHEARTMNAWGRPAMMPKVMPARRSSKGFEVADSERRQQAATKGRKASH